MSGLAYASRVHQLESILIDNECKQILGNLLKQSFLISAPSKLNDYIPEINFLIDFVYYRYTISKNRQFPGQFLQNIMFADGGGGVLTGNQKILYFIVLILGKWFWVRLMQYLEKRYDGQGLYRVLKYLELIVRLIQISHFIYFIGAYRQSTPSYFLLQAMGIILIQREAGITREIDYNLINSTLIWGIVSRIMKGSLNNIINSGIVNKLQSFIMMASFLGSIDQNQQAQQLLQQQGCWICKSEICTMIVGLQPCEHKFCYYCINNSIQNNKCPQCDQQITLIK